jgi:F-type H+-transporting ATPase subunit b
MPDLVLLAAEGGHAVENAPIIPHDFNEVIWGSIAFLIVFGLIIWKGGPAILTMWYGRIGRLQGELETAASARTEAEQELATVSTRIADADSERARLRAEATASAEAVRQQVAARAVQDAEDIRRRGAADIESSKQQVSVDLSAELADLAVGAAEAVVTSNLDAATQADLVERYIASVGETR